jgi:hypothetical protein
MVRKQKGNMKRLKLVGNRPRYTIRVHVYAPAKMDDLDLLMKCFDDYCKSFKTLRRARAHMDRAHFFTGVQFYAEQPFINKKGLVKVILSIPRI